MYLKRAEEEDKRTAEGWKEEAEKVFLFVGVWLLFRTSYLFMGHRLVYFPLSLRLSSRCQFKTFN